MVELKLPPDDAYHKLLHTVEEVNNVLVRAGYNRRKLNHHHHHHHHHNDQHHKVMGS